MRGIKRVSWSVGLRLLVVALLAAALTGCGSIFMRASIYSDGFGYPPYPGVIVDAHEIVASCRDASGPRPSAETVTVDCVFALLLLIDLPLSAAVDTLCLPFDLIAWPLGKHTATRFPT